MELLERAEFLAALQTNFEKIATGEGYCVLVSGEAGIGKTSLVKTFCREKKADCRIYQGTCDALFTPRPLSPLYDIACQIWGNSWERRVNISDRSALFTTLFHEIESQNETVIIVFEDIHWADEATLDFIKFFARRISRLRCLFVLTYRDTEIHSQHPLRNVLGQLPADSFTRLQLTPLRREIVKKMAEEKGLNGEDVYTISGGNPFYVNEILASYSQGVPDNIKDSILSVYNRMDEHTKHIWEILAVLPTAFEITYLEKMEPSYAAAIENHLDLNILIVENGLISFKHELYRRTIETSLSPLVRIALNKKILELFRGSFEKNHEIERIVHHAKNANEFELVVQYAPLAARQAASLGAHIEASRLYLSAIEYYQGGDKDLLIQFYEAYAYECYLTNQVKEAIIYTSKALKIWQEKNEPERIGNAMRFLSRLWWLDRNRKYAETYAMQAIEVLNNQPPSAVKALAFSNMSQLKMLLDDPGECVFWGEKAIGIAKKIGAQEALSHALNNVGFVEMNIAASKQQGVSLLQQSLKIALENSYHEHAARAYSNLGCNSLNLKDYEFARKILDEGIEYCEQRDLDIWRLNMLSLKACLCCEIGHWKQAYHIADHLLRIENPLPSFAIYALNVKATVQMRTGDEDALPLLLRAEELAYETMELQRIIPTLTTLLEYEWLTGKSIIKPQTLDRTAAMMERSIYTLQKNEFAFWLMKARKQSVLLSEVYEGFDVRSISRAQKAARLWNKLGSHYAQAITLFEGNDEDKREAVSMVRNLGANATYQKMKQEMRTAGIRNIPRGMNKGTMSNPANLTQRELDVLQLLKEGMQNKEIGARLFISAKTVDHHVTSILFKLDVNSRAKAVREAIDLNII